LILTSAVIGGPIKIAVPMNSGVEPRGNWPGTSGDAGTDGVEGAEAVTVTVLGAGQVVPGAVVAAEVAVVVGVLPGGGA
jgi:hypothetical protein